MSIRSWLKTRLQSSIPVLPIVFSGHPEDALKANQEAVDIFRILAKGRPAVFNTGLARALYNLSGHRKNALQVIQEAFSVYQILAKDQPALFDFDLAGSLQIVQLLHRYGSWAVCIHG